MAQGPVDYYGRKLIDAKDNVFVVQIPLDVNPDKVEDILLAAQEGIVKFLAYKLKGDVYKDPEHNELGDAAKGYNAPFWKKLLVYDPDQQVTDEEFAKAMEALLKITKDKASKIGKVRVTSWFDHPVEYNKQGFPFIRWNIPCSAEGCGNKITGIRPLSSDEKGNITRPQQFHPDSKEAQRVRQGSKNWLCPHCAVKHIPPPEPEEIPAPVKEVEVKVAAKPPAAPRDIFDTLIDLSKPGSATDPVYFMGLVHGMLLGRKGVIT